jgi:exodeoxyribonuclease VII large subunit
MITVSELNEQIKATLETTFEHVVVEGEVGSATYHSSGHLYFSLKDDESTIKCVMWRSSVAKHKFKIASGEHIVINGYIGVYSPRGEYQLIARKIEPFGKGALALAYEQLKAKLEKEGLFDKSSKKPLPKFPKKIAVVTALESAAFADILNVANKRWPLVEIVAIDTLVQGESAPKMIAKAIEYADTLNVDIILIARGGGSQEDLWAFNEEVVARALHKASIPTVSAIGHEVDFLISDFVADLRAPTPSAAIELILPNKDDYLFAIDDLATKFNRAIEQKIYNAQRELKHLRDSLKTLSPKQRLEFYLQEFNALKNSLKKIMQTKLESKESQLEPLYSLAKNAISIKLQKKSNQLTNLKEQLLLNNPDNKVTEGFVEVTQNGKRVSICNIKKGESFELVSNKCKVAVVAKDSPSNF